MTAFDVLLHGGTVIDGSGAPGVRADVGILGDRILAVGDLSAVDPDGVGLVLDLAGRVVTPGFIDPHGHSDGSLFLDGALASHLHQGFTTQLSGNCGDTPRADHRRRPRAGRPVAPGERARRPLDDLRGVPRSRRRAAARPERRVPRRPRHGPRVGPGRRRPARRRRTSWRRWSARSTPRWTPARSASRRA